MTYNIPAQTIPSDPSIAAGDSTLQAEIDALTKRVVALEAGTIPPVQPPNTSAPAWWTAPVTSRTVQLPPSIDATAATDVTAALIGFIAGVPDGSIVTGAGPAASYKISGSFVNLTARNNVILDGQGATLVNTAIATSGSGWVPYADSFIFWTYGVKPYPTHISIRNWVAKAANPNPGHLQAGSGEYAAFLHSMGGQYIEVTNVTASGLFGDFATLNENSQFIWAHGNHMIDCGRNSVSVVAASHVAITDNAFDTAGYCSFDIEPETGSIAGSADITYARNSHKTWGNCFFAMDGSDAGKTITDVTIDSNSLSSSNLLSVVGGTKSRAQRITFTNNAGAAGGSISFKNIDTLKVVGNTAGGKTLAPVTSGCTNVTTS